MCCRTVRIRRDAASNPTAADSGPGKGGNREGRVEGTVTRVIADSVTITIRGGAAVTVGANAQTKIERNGRRVPLTGILVGDRGQARFDPTTGIATKIESTGP
jgi:hypothetical protein